MAKREPMVRLRVSRVDPHSDKWYWYILGANLGVEMTAWIPRKPSYETKAAACKAGLKVLAALRQAKFVG